MISELHQEHLRVSEHFEADHVKALFDAYVDPYAHYEWLLQGKQGEMLKPRRMIGSYLTYAVREQNLVCSVMVKKDTRKLQVQCDCQEFANHEKCVHIAAVLSALHTQIVAENIQKEYDEKLKSKQETSLEPLSGEHIFSKESGPFASGQPDPKLQKIDAATRKKPFVIPNARDFSFYRLATFIPALRTANRKNRLFQRFEQGPKGFDIQYQYHQEKEIISFQVNEQDDIEVKCSCKQSFPGHLCKHAADTIYFLCDTESIAQFVLYTNQDEEKNKLLADYGLNLSDPEATQFVFSSDYNGKINISYIPPQYAGIQQLHRLIDQIRVPSKIRKLYHSPDDSLQLGLLISLSHQLSVNAPIKLEVCKLETSRKGDEKIQRISIDKDENLTILSSLEDEKYKALMEFSYSHFRDFIGAGLYSQTYQHFTSQYYEATRRLYLKFVYDKLEEHWRLFSEWGFARALIEKQGPGEQTSQSIELFPDPIYAHLQVKVLTRFIEITTAFTDVDGREMIKAGEEMDIFQGRLILCGQRLYLHPRHEICLFLQSMPAGKLCIPVSLAETAMRDILIPIHKKFGVALPESLRPLVKEIGMQPTVHFKEFEGKFLTIAPQFQYDALTILMNDEREYYLEDKQQKSLLLRQRDEEKALVDFVRSLHPQFKLQNYQQFFTLPFDEVMRQHWFIECTRQLMAQSIRLTGVDELTKFRFHRSAPKWDMQIGSGIDWFDVQIHVEWDGQVVHFKEIRKAILSGQNFVVLGDGSFGVLPEEWLQKYKNLFKFAVDDKDGLKISKKQFNIVELLFDQITDEEILAEIEGKKKKLLQVENFKPMPIPSGITATLRPYQETGYQWMQVLDEISWGGCLADDMGLGKTLQAITFLAYVKEKYNKPTSLIICPTSLIFNWENEIKKFAPDLTYHLYYGTAREFSQEDYHKYDLVITSYGIVRNDIEYLRNFQWEYIILDESQAIKNPDAISTKAVHLLKARNKLLLSGTPMQNNTYDIYAQFHFLNPGLLGSREFFRHEFANPIDKEGDKDASLLLRKLIRPFMLRRTKAEVATDLPDKTETILWCQMEKDQKTLYDEYKDYYRHALMQKIESDGMSKSGVYILEGLLRLRQICDDPRLIKDKETKASKGVKIRELIREIAENSGQHKMLIFSQFTEMLALIREELDSLALPYCYLDGSTPAQKRKEEVEAFQSGNASNVFLISLKAGGVGLNLTQADYVYIVDPWWNPAVEQQAIDRTHRIGQSNKIFAYRMICKDTVEEKIIQLQERKMMLTHEIVQEDTAFFKSLTKDDIGYLFS
ncbi:MAG: DEAD/DEAH box helicase [Saprospiraceae bacterium]|nr:DEAD/DEAH box helicase [Saprospiraceae bacterium]